MTSNFEFSQLFAQKISWTWFRVLCQWIRSDRGPENSRRGTKIRLDELYQMHLVFLSDSPKLAKNPKYYRKIAKKLDLFVNKVTIRSVRGPKLETYTDRWNSMSS